MRSSFAALPLVLALSAGIAGASTAAEEPGTRTVLRPTLVAGSAEAISGLVQAGSEGAEWALPGGAKVVASAGTELRVLGVPQALHLPNQRAVNGYTVVLKSGLVRLSVPQNSSSALVLSAPRKTSVIVAHGEAVVSAKDQVAIGNSFGSTQVAFEGRRFRPLPEGMLQVVNAGSRPRPLPAAPSAARGAGVLLSYGEAAALGSFEWDPVPGASGYRVELRDKATNSLRARADTTEPRLPAGFAQLSAGAYALRVVALDESGLESASAPERALRVMRVELPRGSYVDAGGAVHLPRGARLGLSQASGVEMTYGTATHFVSVPTALELFREEPRHIRFRVAGTTESSPLALIPRQESASVEFGAHSESWPQKPLEIRIRLQGGCDAGASAIELRARVTVGVEPVNVAFTRDGDSWRGFLQPRRGTGPWVVRVEVEDQHGTALGRNFIEITTPDVRRQSSGRGS
jgi:hypothetical protein